MTMTDAADGPREGFAAKVVLVTGGASGLGAATVREALDHGAAGVAVLDLPGERAAKAVAGFGERAVLLATDVRVPEQVSAAFEAVRERFGRLDVAVTCAGVAAAARILDRAGRPADLAAFTRVVVINLIGTFDVLRQAAELMARNDPDADGARGVLVLTASIAAYEGQIGQAAYSASKAGIVGMTLPLARDLAAVGIRVCTIAPGIMDTAIFEQVPPEVREAVARVPVFPQRMGRPAEFARLVRAIVENPLLNGEVIRLDAATRLQPR